MRIVEFNIPQEILDAIQPPQDIPQEILRALQNPDHIEEALREAAINFLMDQAVKNSFRYMSRHPFLLVDGLRCALTKNPAIIANCQAAAKMAEYIDTASRVIAGVILFATGAFLIAPDMAKDFFPWMAE